MEIVTMKLADLIPAGYNPRKELQADDAEYQKIKASIETFGLVETLVWNRTTGHIVGGRQRWQVLKDMGVEECQVSVVELPLAKEKALNIALNKISGLWDEAKLAQVLSDLDLEGDIAITGFEQADLAVLAADDEMDFSGFFEPSAPKPDKDKLVTCPECGHQFKP